MSKTRKSSHFFWKILIHFVPGHLLLPLSGDKGTPGKDFFCPGTFHRTSRPMETLVRIPYLTIDNYNWSCRIVFVFFFSCPTYDTRCWRRFWLCKMRHDVQPVVFLVFVSARGSEPLQEIMVYEIQYIVYLAPFYLYSIQSTTELVIIKPRTLLVFYQGYICPVGGLCIVYIRGPCVTYTQVVSMW